jgi:hypothetical protein
MLEETAMSDKPKIEYKRGKLTKLLFEEQVRAEALRRELLRFEQDLIEMGYADKHARVHVPTLSPRSGAPRFVIWTAGKLHLYGKTLPDLNSDQLLMLSELSPQLLDDLEKGQRWMIQRLEQALETLHAFLERVKSEPVPNEHKEQADEQQDADS